MNIIPSELTASKELQENLVNELVLQVKEGNESALKTAAKIKFISDSLKAAQDEIKPYVIEELERYDKRERVSIVGYSAELKEMVVKYIYDNCNHPKWEELNSEIERLQKEKKEIEKFLQGIKGHVIITDEETGETRQVYAPQKQSTTTAVFSFPKS